MTLMPALALALTLAACGDKEDDDGGSGDGGAEDGGTSGDGGTGDGGTGGDGGGSSQDDADGDGYSAESAGGDDCDDSDGSVHPGATEICNDGVDDDCDDLFDDADDSLDTSTATTWYTDADDDGYGAEGSELLACEDPGAAATVGGDCDDSDPAVNPDATEVCNDGIDDDCNDLADDADTGLDTSTATSWYSDGDRDGYGTGTGTLSCLQPPDTADEGGDCDDEDAAVNPGREEACNGVDDDCDETTTEDGTVSIGVVSYGSIQDAVDAAGSTDTVMVCTGTFEENLTIAGPVAIVGVEGAAATTIVGDGTAATITYSGDLELTGLTITGGSSYAGGGIDGFSATGGELTLTECVVTGNSADFGGGVLTYYGDLVLESTEVHGNTATASGGGIYATSLVSSKATIYDNEALYGGGLYVETSGADLDEDTWIYGNSVDAASGLGGGICATLAATVYLDGTLISDNTAGYAAGAYLEGEAVLEGGEFTGNDAAITGGGVVLGVDDTWAYDFEAWGNMATYGGGAGVWGTGSGIEGAEIYANEATSYGGGIIFSSEAEAELSDVSVDGNQAEYGGGILFEGDNVAALSQVYIDNNIASGQGGGFYLNSGTLELEGGSVSSNYAGSSGGGALLYDGRLSVSGTDWGEDSSDNDPEDLYLEDLGLTYEGYGESASFECADTGCS